jgi:hypothetical protein
MRDKPGTAFGTMNTDILEATVPGYVRPNLCDYIQLALRDVAGAHFVADQR